MDNQLIQWIEKERKLRRLTYRGLSEYLDMSHTQVTKILKGKSPVSIEFCNEMAKYFQEPILKFIVMGNVIPDEFELKKLILGYLNLPRPRQSELLVYVDFLKNLDK